MQIKMIYNLDTSVIRVILTLNSFIKKGDNRDVLQDSHFMYQTLE